jgi:hypothetical protein
MAKVLRAEKRENKLHREFKTDYQFWKKVNIINNFSLVFAPLTVFISISFLIAISFLLSCSISLVKWKLYHFENDDDI